MKCEHILLIRFSALGDVAMTVPVVYSLAEKYPNVRIAFLSRPMMAPLFANMPQNVTFMAADVKGEYKGILGLNRLYRRLTAKNFTAVADLHDTLRSIYLRSRFDLSSMSVAHIDKHKEGRRSLVKRHNKVLVQQQSQITNYSDVLDKLGYPVEITFKSLFPEGGADLSQLPAGVWHEKKESPWIGIAPFAGHKGKEYPAPLVRKVIEKILVAEPLARIFVFGGVGELARINEMTKGINQCVNVAGKLGLSGDLALISHLDVMLSMDSANMHLASLTATPVVSLWGATHPFAGFLGYGQREDDCIQIQMQCRPCSAFGAEKCLRGDYACMAGISPDVVAAKVLSKLKK
jgi:ADP-heptose:LPS heptosyltransferase